MDERKHIDAEICSDYLTDAINIGYFTVGVEIEIITGEAE